MKPNGITRSKGAIPLNSFGRIPGPVLGSKYPRGKPQELFKKNDGLQNSG
jgi:hypothetical protein